MRKWIWVLKWVHVLKKIEFQPQSNYIFFYYVSNFAGSRRSDHCATRPAAAIYNVWDLSDSF